MAFCGSVICGFVSCFAASVSGRYANHELLAARHRMRLGLARQIENSSGRVHFTEEKKTERPPVWYIWQV